MRVGASVGARAGAWWLVPLCLVAGACRSTSRPDVIVITLDTTRADRLGIYGHAGGTPAIDAFAHDSVVYPHAWSTASWTLPAHASLVTGKYPTAHGAHLPAATTPPERREDTPRLEEDQTTLAEVLAGAGYRTAAFAAAGWLKPEFGVLQGYATREANGMVAADVLTDRALAWLREVPRGQPVHVLLNYFDAHPIYLPHEGYDVRLPKVPDTLREVIDAVAADPSLRDQLLHPYDEEIRFMDHQLGRLFEALRGLGRYRDALIILTADHGEMFGEHGAMGHGAWLYEEVLHVPLVIHYPGGRGAGTTDAAPVSLVDVLPLALDQLGLPPPAGIDGAVPGHRTLLLAEEFRSPLIAKQLGPGLDRELVAAVRWPWKLIVPSRGTPELYRLDEDPREQHQREGAPEAAGLRVALDQAHAALTPAALGPPHPLPAETRAMLKALGYVD